MMRPYRERLEELQQILVGQGSLALLLIDISRLTQIENDYGSRAFNKVLESVTDLILELRGTEVRASDVLAVNERGGDAFLLFLSPKRDDSQPRVADLQSAAQRVESHLNRRLTGLASPYLPSRQRRVTVGFGLVFFNPLVMPERLVARLVEEARESVRVSRMQQEFQKRCHVQDVLLENRVTTLFQPIVSLEGRSVLGYEALSRGPSGTPYHMPLALFEMAAESDMAFELDRHCRRRSLRSARGLPPGARLFVNVFPSTIYDPEFQGEKLIGLLGELGLDPGRIVLEITEKYAIENYALFVEALQNLTQMGFAIAVDDIGAGHSGLETIAHLTPQFLKFDMQLVRDIDGSYVRREMTRALKVFADKMGSTIIAEGIEREEELKALVDLGIDYGQGYLLGRPAETFEHVLAGASRRPSAENGAAVVCEKGSLVPLPPDS